MCGAGWGGCRPHAGLLSSGVEQKDHVQISGDQEAWSGRTLNAITLTRGEKASLQSWMSPVLCDVSVTLVPLEAESCSYDSSDCWRWLSVNTNK